MPWLRMDDGFTTHPKVMGLSLEAKVLWMYSLGHCAHELTDGLVQARVVPALGGLAGLTDANAAAEELVASGLWETDPQGFRVHDYLVYNPSRAAVLEDREKAKVRMQRLRGSGEVRQNLIDPVPGPGPVPGPKPGPGSPGADAPAPAAPRRKAPTVPAEREAPKNAEQYAALCRIEGLDPDGDPPKSKRGQLNLRASECAAQKWTGRAIEKIAELWEIEHPEIPCTANVVVMHGARLLAHPPRAPAIRTNGKSATWQPLRMAARPESVHADGTITDADGNLIGREGDALN